jgi:hypothetical protein
MTVKSISILPGKVLLFDISYFKKGLTERIDFHLTCNIFESNFCSASLEEARDNTDEKALNSIGENFKFSISAFIREVANAFFPK